MSPLISHSGILYCMNVMLDSSSQHFPVAWRQDNPWMHTVEGFSTPTGEWRQKWQLLMHKLLNGLCISDTRHISGDSLSELAHSRFVCSQPQNLTDFSFFCWLNLQFSSCLLCATLKLVLS